MVDEREDVVTVRMSRDERRMLQELADADGLTVSAAMRMMVRRIHSERFSATKKPKTRR